MRLVKRDHLFACQPRELLYHYGCSGGGGGTSVNFFLDTVLVFLRVSSWLLVDGRLSDFKVASVLSGSEGPRTFSSERGSESTISTTTSPPNSLAKIESNSSTLTFGSSGGGG